MAAAWKDGAASLSLNNHTAWFALGGVLLCSNNLFYIVGVSFANTVLGAGWQTASPVFTLCITLAMGWETASSLKLGGIALAMVCCCSHGQLL